MKVNQQLVLSHSLLKAYEINPTPARSSLGAKKYEKNGFAEAQLRLCEPVFWRKSPYTTGEGGKGGWGNWARGFEKTIGYFLYNMIGREK